MIFTRYEDVIISVSPFSELYRQTASAWPVGVRAHTVALYVCRFKGALTHLETYKILIKFIFHIA